MLPLFNRTTTYANTNFVIFQFLQKNVWLVHRNRLQLFPPTFGLVLHASTTSYFMTLRIFDNHMSQLHDMLGFCSVFPKF